MDFAMRGSYFRIEKFKEARKSRQTVGPVGSVEGRLSEGTQEGGIKPPLRRIEERTRP
jgi:hypothetical protein